MLLLRFLLLLALSQCQGQPCDQPAIWAAEWRRPAGSSTTGALRSQIQSRTLPVLTPPPRPNRVSLLLGLGSRSDRISDHSSTRHVACADLPSGPPLPVSVDPPRWWAVAAPVRSQPCNAKTWSLSTAFTDGSIDRCRGVSFDSKRAVTPCMNMHGGGSVTTMSEQP